MRQYYKLKRGYNARERERERERERLLNICLGGLALFIFGYYYIQTIMGDSWVYSTIYPINIPFFQIGGHHPGRHISELLSVVPGQVIAPILGKLINNPLLATKLLFSLQNALIFTALMWVSSYFISFDMGQIKRKVLVLFLSFFAFFLPYLFGSKVLIGWSYVFGQMVAGGFLLILSLFVFILYYFEKGQVPFIVSKEQSLLNITLLLPILYLCTQIVEGANIFFLIFYLSLVFLFILAHFFPENFPKLPNFSRQHIYFSILFVFFILWGAFRSAYKTSRASSLDFKLADPIAMFTRFKSYLLPETYVSKTTSLMVGLMLLLSLFIALFIIIKALRYKKIEKTDSFTLAGIGSFYSYVLIISALSSYYDQGLWMLYLILIKYFIQVYRKAQPLVRLFLPVFLVFSALLALKPILFHTKIFLSVYGDEGRLVKIYQETEALGQKSFVLDSTSILQSIPPPYGWHHTISDWMVINGYTKNHIEMVFPETLTNTEATKNTN